MSYTGTGKCTFPPVMWLVRLVGAGRCTRVGHSKEPTRIGPCMTYLPPLLPLAAACTRSQKPAAVYPHQLVPCETRNVGHQHEDVHMKTTARSLAYALPRVLQGIPVLRKMQCSAVRGTCLQHTAQGALREQALYAAFG